MMSDHDRLSALMQHFQMSVSAPVPGGNLVIFGNRTENPEGVEFKPQSGASEVPPDQRLFEAKAEWGGDANPLLRALPDRLLLDTDQDTTVGPLLQALVSEANADRCGSTSAVNRLGEVLIIRLLRSQIEQGATTPGLLAGLADPRLSRALVAMHDRPERDWRNAELADVAGMSRSRFADLFARTVGETPQSYLRRWRMILARQSIATGERIQSVARRLGYGSPEALSRAFNRHFGVSPMTIRRKAHDVNMSTKP